MLMTVARREYDVRIGQTSAIHFGSEVLASLAGFVATLYIARELGGSVLGTYALFIAVVIWVKTGFGSGLHQAVKKRVSEVGDSQRYLGAGLLLQAVAFVAVSIAILLARDPLNAYLGFDGAGLLVATLGVVLATSFVASILHGEQNVHLASVLRPLDRVVRSGVQLAVVFLGVLGGGLVGLIWGYVAGAIVAVIVGLVFVSLRPKWPRREHVVSVLDFTRYSWLSGVEGRSFSAMDTVVLGVFVSTTLIGYYEVAWNLASLLAIFGTSISESLFPTISELESSDEHGEIRDLVNNGLAYSGLFLIPGLVGVLLVGEHVLGLYGSEFEQAGTVLAILVVARLVYAYESQFVMTLNAVDYPDVAFRVNVVFVAANLGLNVLFVYLYGWTGAAVATALAALIGLFVAYAALRRIMTVGLPLPEVGRQVAAAAVMGAVLYPAREVVVTATSASLLETLLLVSLGAGVYFVTLLVLSARFRTTVRDNVAL